jgi:hypothetical protein
MPNDLVKQAMLDAQAIRAVAEANARMMLEEAFKPEITSLITKSLRQELKEGINPSSSGIGKGLTVDNPAPKNPSGGTNQSSNIPNPGLEIEDIYGEDTPGLGKISEAFGDEEDEFGGMATEPGVPPAPGLGGPPPQAPGAVPPVPGAGAVPPAPGAMPPGVEGGMAPEMGADGAVDALAQDELDLDAIIRELELDIANDQQGAPDAAGVPAPQGQPQLEGYDQVDDKSVDFAKKDGALKEATDPNSDGKDGKSPTAVDGVNGGKKVSAGQKVTASGDEKMKTIKQLDEDAALDEILREMGVADEDSAPIAETSAITAENVELRRALREQSEAIKVLQETMNEMNLLNAKLLFTNKLFRGFSLSENQKKHIVESFDRATNVREVKLIFTTLAENYIGRTGSPTASKKSASLMESIASKPIGSTKPKTQPQVANESDALRTRFMQLARISPLP